MQDRVSFLRPRPGRRRGLRATLRRSMALCLAAVLLTSCAETRLIEKPGSLTGTLGIEAQTPELRVEVRHLVLPDGPGAWVRGAKWDEYVLSIRNRSEETLTIQGFWLIDVRGVYIEDSQSPARLESVSQALEREYHTVQLKTAVGVATAATSSSLLAGGAAAGGALAAVGPVALLALPFVPYIEFKARAARELEQDEIQRRFTTRRLVSQKYAGGTSVGGSVFFPVVPNPRALVVGYRVSGKSGELRLPLDRIRGMHEALAKKLKAERERRKSEWEKVWEKDGLGRDGD